MQREKQRKFSSFAFLTRQLTSMDVVAVGHAASRVGDEESLERYMRHSVSQDNTEDDPAVQRYKNNGHYLHFSTTDATTLYEQETFSRRLHFFTVRVLNLFHKFG